MGQAPAREAPWLAAALGGGFQRCASPEETTETRTLSALLRPSDVTVLKVLKERFEEEEIYTYGALKSLVVMNPFRPVSCLAEDEVLPAYKAPMVDELEGPSSFTQEEPHIWAACREAWAFIRRSKKSVSFVIQGESGAGKTETAKHVMLYFSSPATKPVASTPSRRRRSSVVSLANGRMDSAASLGLLEGQEAGVQQIMMSANPITEALGNARTLRNDNSSRFGRFVKLFLDATGEIQCSEMSIYSLEKSRVVLQASGERNFHVFYQLLRGCNEEQRAAHRLRGRPEDYEMLCGGGVLEVAGVDDASDWQRLQTAFRGVGASQEMLHGFVDVLSATLLCGEVKWVGEAPGDAAVCQSQETFGDLAQLLGVSAALLEVALSTKKRVMPRGSIVSSPLTPNQAKELTESIARSLYEALFMWAVELVNRRSRKDGSTADMPFAGVLDIFGFEAFKLNSLEQLFINYCNERLHQFFIEAAFKREQQMCKEEGIIIELKFQDNSNILQAIDSQDAKGGLGILPLLEEQCGLQSGSNEAFTQSCHRRFAKSESKCYVEPKIAPREHFEIKHSCCPVRYNTTHFREKNMDVMPTEVLQLLLGSSKPFVKEVLQGVLPDTVSEKPKKGFIAAQLLRSVGALFSLLRSCEPKFVKCVKTNHQKQPMVIDEELVKSQLHTLSIIESLQIERQGYTYKKLYNEFLEEHTSLCVVVHGCLPSGPGWAQRLAAKGLSEDVAAKQMALEVLAAVGGPPEASKEALKGYAQGAKRLFLTSAMQEWCEWMRRQARAAVDDYAASMQAIVRARRVARESSRELRNLVALQSCWRRFQAIKLEVQVRRRRRRLRGIWLAISRFTWALARHRARRRRRRARGLWATCRAAASLVCGLQRARQRAVEQQRKQMLQRCRAVAVFRGLLHRVRQRLARKRLCTLRGRLRGAVHLLRGYLWARRRRRAAVEVQRHVRTFLQRETLKALARQRGQRHAVHCFRSIGKRFQAQEELLWCRFLAAQRLFKHVLGIFDARGVVARLRRERNARMIQTITRGLLCRRKFKELLQRRRANASRELKAYLEAARCRLRFAEFRRCEGFHRAGQLLAETKSMNSLLSMSSRYGLRTASRERPRAQGSLASVSIKEASPKASPKAPKAPTEVVKSLQILRASAQTMTRPRTARKERVEAPKTPKTPEAQRVVAQNGASITGTSRGHSSRSPRRASPENTRPVQLRSWLERAHQEANALYTSGALRGLRSPRREAPVDPRAEMFAYPRSMSPPRAPQPEPASPESSPPAGDVPAVTEVLLQSQLKSTQQQLEDLQRQYSEVQELLQKRSGHTAGPSVSPRRGREAPQRRSPGRPGETSSPSRRR